VLHLLCILIFKGIKEGIIFSLVLQPHGNGKPFKPAAKGTGLSQLANLSKGLQKNLLGQVICQGGIAATTTHQVSNPGLAASHQFSKGLLVTRLSETNYQCFLAVSIEVLH
jgi:hypothetical protein